MASQLEKTASPTAEESAPAATEEPKLVLPKETKVLLYRKFGGPEVVEFGTLPIPEVKENEVLLKVHAASFNPIDYKRRDGLMKALAKERFPVRLGYDGSGEIVHVGSNVTQWKVGDQVFVRIKGSKTGMAGEYHVVDADVIALKPSNLTFEEAAGVPLAGLTAYQSLQRLGVKEGSSVLITGGAGGVGTFAIQLAKNVFKAGRVVTTASPGEKTELVKSLGADEVINYREEGWEEKYEGGAFDNAFDTAGDALKAVKLTKAGGQVVSVADKPTSTEIKSRFDIGFLISWYLDYSASSITKPAKKKGVTYSYLFMIPGTEDLTKLKNFIEEGKVRPIIDSIHPFDKAAEALAKTESGRAAGKVVVKVV